MARSLRVAPEYIQKVRLALNRNGFPSQRALAMELGLSHSTVARFINGKPVDYLTFVEISEKIGLDWQALADLARSAYEDLAVSNSGIAASFQDWGDAPDVPVFFGRTEELATLEQWIVYEHCRLVAIVGLGGIGKTKLSMKLGKGGIGKTDLSLTLARGIEEAFEYVIWRSLLNAPSVSNLLADLIKFLSNQQETELPDTVDGQVSRLLHYLRQHRCLLILDNAETILQGSERAGQYREGYEGYGQLLRQVGEIPHQSCLLLTSREKPQEIALLEGRTRPVRSLELSGLSNIDGKKIFTEIGSFSGSDDDWRELIEFYNGNPLALEIVAKHIDEVFFGNISEFLEAGKPVFDDLKDLLDWYFDRLSDPEKDVMYWLAINREPISPSELREDTLSLVFKEQVPATLQSLVRRLPLERSAAGFTLQPVLIEYMSEQLIKRVCEEISSGQFELFNSHALIKATAKDYVRETQVRLILKPVAEFLITLNDNKSLNTWVNQVLSTLRTSSQPSLGYASGNILNLLCHLNAKLSDYDFSYLSVKQAYLQGYTLHGINFFRSDIVKSIFTNTLDSIFSVEFSPDGRLLATGDANGEIRFWQVLDGKQILTLRGHRAWVQSVTFSPDGQTLASSSQDLSIRLWNVYTGHCLKILHGHNCRVRSVRFSQNGQTLAGGSDDYTVMLWNVQTGECFQILLGHTKRVRSVAFNFDGQILASGSYDNTVKLWDVSTGELLRTLEGHSDVVRSVAFSSDGQTLASGSGDNTVKLWDVSRGQLLRTLKGHSERVNSVSFNPQGTTLASGSDDNTVKLWDVCTGNCLQTVLGHSSGVSSVAFSPQDKSLASGSYDNTVKLWNVSQGKCLKTWQGYDNSVRSVTFNPQGTTLASGSDDNTVKLWDVSTGQFLRTLQGHSAWVRSVNFSPDGQTLASSGGDNTIKLWDVRTAQCIKTLGEHKSGTRSVAFSPDGQLLAIGSTNKTVKLWNVRTGEYLNTLIGHTDWVRSVAFSPDGQILASSSGDGIVKLWNVFTGECLKTLKGHTSSVRSVAFSPQAEILFSASYDRTIRL